MRPRLAVEANAVETASTEAAADEVDASRSEPTAVEDRADCCALYRCSMITADSARRLRARAGELLSPLKLSSYRRLWSADMISLLGDWAAGWRWPWWCMSAPARPPGLPR